MKNVTLLNYIIVALTFAVGLVVGLLWLMMFPSDSQEQPPVSESHSSFNLIATYTFDPTSEPDANNWTLGRNDMASKYRQYPLLSGDFIETYTETLDVFEASRNNSPLLWLVRADLEGVNYVLVAIDDPQPLLQLQMEITPTQNIADIIPAPDPEAIEEEECPETSQSVNKLSLTGNSQVKLGSELMSQDGIAIPLNIVGIDYHETAEIAGWCYREIGFALHKTADPDPEGYRLLMVLNNETGRIGPPGGAWRGRCSNWRGGGWWSRWRRSWYGCS